MGTLKKMYILVAVAVISVGIALVPAGSVSAVQGSDFNPANIIDDTVFFNSNTMNTGDIQNFLNAKRPTCRSGYTCLKDYQQSFNSVAANAYCGAITGGTKSAANIIYDVARACGVNPQTLIVLLEKEQSLVLDDWPLDTQYRIATGYGCPDTAPCDAEYYGFFNQVYNAGKQFKRYVAQPNTFNYAAGRNSFVGYNPNAACGGTNIAIQNGATAALYNYTPYQPNAAALSNLYGTGDGCSAYGNRNFWRLFNDWFGPTTGDGYVLAMNEDDNSQWVIYRGIKQYVPSAEIKQAWGLPDAAVPMSGHYLSGIPEGPHLGRLFHLIGDPTLYFADGGKKYRVTSTQMRDAWGFTGQTESFVSLGLWSLPQYNGHLTYSVKTASNPALYMIDGKNNSGQMVLRQYAGPDVYHAWEGDADAYTTLSDTYFDSIDNAIGAALTGYTIKGDNSSEQYHVVAGQKLYLSGEQSAVYDQTYQTVSDYTINRLVTSAPVTNFVRLPGNGVTIYMVDNGQKLPVSSPDVLKAWSPNGNVNVNILNQGFLNLLTTGTAVNGYEGDVAGQLYFVDGRKYTVSAGLDDGYRTGNIASVSADLMNLYPTSTATGFIKGASPAIYLLDNGLKRHVNSIEAWQLWNGTRGEVLTQVSDAALTQFSTGNTVGYYFEADGTNYVMDNGVYHSVSSDVATDWGFSSPSTAIDTSTLARFSAGGALQTKAKVGSSYYRVKYGKSHVTEDTNLAGVWGLLSSPTEVSTTLIDRVAKGPMLNIFARSTDTNDHRVFLVDNGGTTFTHIVSIEQLLNYGYSSGAMVEVRPADLGTVGSTKNIIKTTDADSERLVDGGSKRAFSSTTVKDRWVGTDNVQTVSSYLWNRLSTYINVTGNIKASAPNVYTINEGEKQWLQTQSAYQNYTGLYGSQSQVTDWLAQLLPDGAGIE